MRTEEGHERVDSIEGPSGVHYKAGTLVSHGSMVHRPISDRRSLLLALAVGGIALALPRRADAKKPAAPAPIPLLPISVAIADSGDADEPKPVRDTAWVDAQIAAAERLFGPHGVHFKRGEVRALPSAFAKLESREDRDRLASHLEGGRINVFVVASLRDVDDPERLRMGVHWRKLSNLKKRYIIVAASAMPTTLAHELGHYFGNGHSSVPNNVMSYVRTGEDVFFDAVQIRKIQSTARAVVRTKELIPIDG
jgi:hypothetical protein